MSPEEYATVIKGICSQLQIVPDDTLMINVTQFCRKRDLNLMRSKYQSDDDFHQHLINLYIKYLSKDDLIAEQKMLDDKAASLHKKPSKKSRSSIMGPLAQWIDRSMHIDIDSLNRDISMDYGSVVTDFRFVLSARNDRAPLGSGIVPARLIPANITYMKVGRIILPYSQALASLNNNQEITLTFTGLRSNGAIIANLITNETIHFSFTYTECAFNNNLVELVPTNKYCKFDPPLTYLDNVSVRWNDPRYPVQFDSDRMRPQSLNYASTDGQITFATNHHLNTGDTIIIDGLTTNDDTDNTNILGLINSPRGIKITKLSDTTISTGIDFASIISPDTSSLPIIIFTSKCFRIPLEIGYQDTDELA
jgi:hypothetical protein